MSTAVDSAHKRGRHGRSGGSWRIGAASVFALLSATVTAPVAAQDELALPSTANLGHTAICSAGDRSETGMQGETPLTDIASGRSAQPYSCGLRIVSRTDVWAGQGGGFIQRSGDCAFVYGSDERGGGLAVVDLADPARPRVVTRLQTPATSGASETMDVVQTASRSLLVAGDYSGGVTPPGPAPMEIYDVTDCRSPRLLSTFNWPANVHVPSITPDGTRIYAGRQFGIAGVMVMDISDPENPVYMGDFPLILPDGRQQRCHDISFNAEQTRMYCAGSVPLIENRKSDSAPSIWDISQVGVTNLGPSGSWPAITFVAAPEVRGQGDHHAPLARINGRTYMIAANELRCTAFPRIFDITDETRMRMVGEFRLRSNDRCLDDPAWAEANRAGGYGLHYNSVVEDAFGSVALGLFNFMGSGMRVVDLRDPAHPREIAYFHPGDLPVRASPEGSADTARPAMPRDACVSKNFFDHETGYIWFGCRSGLYVAELSPEVLAYLGLPTARR